MVADAAVIAGAEIGAVGLHVAMGGVGFGEEGEGEDVGLLVGKGGGVGENVVEGGPFALVCVGAGLESGGAVDEAMAAGEEFELRGVGFGIEIAHDDEVGVLPDSTDGVGVCLQLLTDAHAEFLSLAAASFGGQMEHIHVHGVASCDGACHMQDVACGLFTKLWTNRLFFNGMEGERRVE